MPGPPPELKAQGEAFERYREKAFALLSISVMSSCCQVCFCSCHSFLAMVPTFPFCQIHHGSHGMTEWSAIYSVQVVKAARNHSAKLLFTIASFISLPRSIYPEVSAAFLVPCVAWIAWFWLMGGWGSRWACLQEQQKQGRWQSRFLQGVDQITCCSTLRCCYTPQCRRMQKLRVGHFRLLLDCS